jgi:hypothetical protein
MRDLVPDELSVPAFPEPPLMFLEKMLEAVFMRRNRRFLARDRDSMFPAADARNVTDRDLRTVLLHPTAHRRAYIRLVVERSGKP